MSHKVPMRTLHWLVIWGSFASLAACSDTSGGDLDYASDCQDRMAAADPTETVSHMAADVRPGTFRTDVYVTGTIATGGGPVPDRFHCVYNGEALVSDDRTSAPPAAPPSPGGSPAAAAPPGATTPP